MVEKGTGEVNKMTCWTRALNIALITHANSLGHSPSLFGIQVDEYDTRIDASVPYAS